MTLRRVFPFIVGCGRSGTTLLRVMLDSHPDMAIPHESYFITRLLPSAAEPAGRRRTRFWLETHRAGGFSPDSFLESLVSDRWFPRWELPVESLRRAFGVERPSSYADAVRAVFACYADFHGKGRYGDKTPQYVLEMPLIASHFPEARFIHLIRDGRDVGLSLLDVDFGPDTLTDAALYWRRIVCKGRHDGKRLGPERYREIRYETLVERPSETLKEVCAFIELPYDDSLLRYFERPDVLREIRKPHQHRHETQRPTPGLRDWRGTMTRKMVVTFESIAGDLLADLGYESGVVRMPLARRASGVTYRAVDTVRHGIGSVRRAMALRQA